MTQYADRYCVILTDYMHIFPRHWPITYVADTLEDAKAEGFFDANPQLVDRSAYAPELKAETSMIYTPTYKPFRGGVFLMRPIGRDF